jgi:hypothetical protein
MKLKIEAKFSRIEGVVEPGWWSRRVSVPLPVVVAALAVFVVLGILLVRKTTPIASTPPLAPASARFLGVDTTVHGAWKSRYGAGGYAIAGDGRRTSAIAEIVIPGGKQSWKWIDEIEDIRALQKESGGKRIAAAWFGWEPLTIGVKLTDSKTHQLAVYLIDWDAVKRNESIEVLDGISGQLLDSREISDFSQGQYLTWTVTGHVVLKIGALSSTTAVISGVFID